MVSISRVSKYHSLLQYTERAEGFFKKVMHPIPDLLSLHTAEQYDAAIASRMEAPSSQTMLQELQIILSQRNERIPAISRLHDELLAKIFAILVEECVQEGYDEYGSPSAWIVVSHVCRRWRNVALENASLWASNITLLNDKDRLQVFLRRSKQAPLFISSPADPEYDRVDDDNTDGDPSEELDPDILRTLQSRASRFRSLKLVVTDRLLNSLTESSSLDAPGLKKLDITLKGPLRDIPTAFWFLSGAPMALLQVLNVTSLPSGLSHTLIRPSLTQLTVSYSIATVGSWLEVLTQTPSLQLLSLTESLNLGPPETLPTPGTTIALSSLRKLVLNGEIPGSVYARLLTHLDVPKACRIHLLRCNSHMHPLLFSAVSPKLSNACVDTQRRALRACVIDAGNDVVSIEFWQDASDAVRYRLPYTPDWDLVSQLVLIGHVQPHLHITLSCQPMDRGENVLASALSHLPLSTVDTLFTFTHNLMHEDDTEPYLHTLYAPLRHVRHLYACEPSPQRLLQALAQPAPSDSDPAAQSSVVYPVFPHLRHLTLRGVKWHAHGARCAPPYGGDTPLNDVEAAVVARRAMGMPLASVRLEKLLNVGPGDTALLEQMLKAMDELGWDGRTDLQESRCSICPMNIHEILGRHPSKFVAIPLIYGDGFGDGN